jgi:formylglycine-generating enzyme required for sulfatase activity
LTRLSQGIFCLPLGFALAISTTLAAELPRSFVGADGAEMNLVPTGDFVMGSLEGEEDERPPRRVSLPAFYMDKHEVTHEQYARFLAATGRPAPVDWPQGRMPAQLTRHPVVNVTFDDAAAYARWAGKRLPTEAEWEKACRGPDGRTYPWGDERAHKKTATPLGDNSKDHTWPVESFPDDISPYGLMDMAGNAWEWTDSWYEAYPGNGQSQMEYGRKYRVIRGGGAIDYYGASSTRRCADRARSLPYGTYDALGFRCVKNAEGGRP